MSIARKSSAAKVVAGFAGLAMAVSFAFAGAIQASAQSSDDTVSELRAQIQALQEQLQALQGGGSSSSAMGCSVQFTQNLSTGDQGSQVKQVQMFLNNQVDGVSVGQPGTPGGPGSETNYFGPKTASAVTEFQEMFAAEVLAPVGLSQGTGYWGPSSRSKANAMCEGAASGDEDMDEGDESSDEESDEEEDEEDRELSGGAGSLDEAEWVSSVNNEDVGEGADDVEVAGLEMEADDSSDIEITALALNFDRVTSGSGADQDFNDYAQNVSIWADGEKLAEVDANKFDDDSNYSQTVSLDQGPIIRAGETKDVMIAVSGVDNLDSNNQGERWNVGVENVRFRDGQNAIITDTATDDIGNSDDDSSTGSDEREFSFESFASGANTEFSIKDGPDSVNEARIVEVDSSDDTENVELLEFDVEIEGSSDVNLDDLPITYSSSGSNVDVIANEFSLYVDGEQVGSESPGISSNSGTTTFAELDFDMEAGETYTFTVQADITPTDTLNEGDSLSASIGETQTDSTSMDLEDESGEQLADADKTGSSNGEEHVFYENAFNLSNFETDFEAQDTSDSNVDVKGVYTFTFDITSFGADLYLATTTASTSASGDQGIEYRLTGDDPAGASISDTFSLKGETETGGGGDAAWAIEEGDTEEVELQVFVDNSGNSSGVFGVEVDTIRFTDSQDSGFGTGSYLSDIANYADSISSPTGNLDELDIANQSLN